MATTVDTPGLKPLPAVADSLPALDPRILRWWVKKLVRALFASSSMALRAVLPRREPPRVRVLTYHRFGNARRDAFCVSVDAFERQMAWLAESRLAISLEQLGAFLTGAADLPTDVVLVTVDDGNPCLLSRALPIAARHGVPLVAFVPAGELAASAADRGAALDSPDARLTSTELRELAAGGVVIGSHALTHRSVARLPADAQREEVGRSRTVLQEVTGRPIEAFAYPFGTRADYDAATTAALAAAGYRFGFTSQHGAVTPGTDPLMLPRVKVEGGEGLWMFRAIVRGGMDGWRWIDRLLWRVQATP